MPPTAAATFRSSITDTKQAPNESTSHSSKVQINAPHTHGVACWCCWTVVNSRCALCVLAVLMAVFMRGQKADRMFTSLWVRYARMMCTFFFCLNQRHAKTQCPKACANPMPGCMGKPIPRGDAETQSPGMFRKPGICLINAQGQKSVKGLASATH